MQLQFTLAEAQALRGRYPGPLVGPRTGCNCKCSGPAVARQRRTAGRFKHRIARPGAAARCQPLAAADQPFQRLHSEAQMLPYSHPFNDSVRRGELPPVQWLLAARGRGAGAGARPHRPHPSFLVDGLRQAALRQDWAAWQQAWQQAEAGPIAQLLAHVRAGGQATLTLCGEAQALHFKRARSALMQRFQSLFKPKTFNSLRNQL